MFTSETFSDLFLTARSVSAHSPCLRVLAGLAHKQSSEKGSVGMRCHTDPDFGTVVNESTGPHSFFSSPCLESNFSSLCLYHVLASQRYSTSPHQSIVKSKLWSEMMLCLFFQSAHYTLSHVYSLTSLSILISVQRRP